MIEFERYGHGPNKLVGIHGWLGDEKSFKPLEQSLDPAEFECVWLAHRGYGRSVAVEGRYDMAEMARDALAVTEQLGWSSFSVIGHSMGGKAAQLVAAWAPDRVHKLIAVAPVAADPVPFDKDMRALFVNAADSHDCRRTIFDFSTGNRLSPFLVEQVVSDSFQRSKREAFAAYFLSWADEDLSEIINDSGTDTLVVVGAQDPVVTSEVCEFGFRQRYRKLEIKELEGSGHYPMDEAPLRFGAEVLRHLRS